MRSFIGINFSKEVKEDIAAVQREIRSNAAKGRFKHVDNFHITLKFLGEIEAGQPEQIAHELEKIAAKHQEFELQLKDIGCFKSRGEIRTLYIGMGGDIKALNELNEDVEKAMEPLGFKRENRPFTPHITLSQDLTLNMPFEQLKQQIDMAHTNRIHVSKIELIKSEQIKNKRVYTPIYSYELNKR